MTISKSDLMRPGRAKGTSTIGPGHDGAPQPDFYAGPNDAACSAHHVSHGNGQHIEGGAVKGNLARDGAAKRTNVVPVHRGMTPAQHYGAASMGGTPGGGLGHATSSAIPGENPLSPNAVTIGKAKELTPPKITPGMRSRTTPELSDEMHQALSAAVFAQAKRN
jgi:hypothetical protein